MGFNEKVHAFIAASFYTHLTESFGERGRLAFVHATQYYAEQRGRRMEMCIRDSNMGDAHEVVVDHVGKVVGGKPVALEQDVVVKRIVGGGDGAEHRILKHRDAALRNLLADDVGHPVAQLLLHFLPGEVAAVPVVFGGHLGGLLHQTQLVKPLLVAKTVVGGAFFHQLKGILPVDVLALALDVYKRQVPAC